MMIILSIGTIMIVVIGLQLRIILEVFLISILFINLRLRLRGFIWNGDSHRINRLRICDLWIGNSRHLRIGHRHLVLLIVHILLQNRHTMVPTFRRSSISSSRSLFRIHFQEMEQILVENLAHSLYVDASRGSHLVFMTCHFTAKVFVGGARCHITVVFCAFLNHARNSRIPHEELDLIMVDIFNKKIGGRRQLCIFFL